MNTHDYVPVNCIHRNKEREAWPQNPKAAAGQWTLLSVSRTELRSPECREMVGVYDKLSLLPASEGTGSLALWVNSGFDGETLSCKIRIRSSLQRFSTSTLDHNTHSVSHASTGVQTCIHTGRWHVHVYMKRREGMGTETCVYQVRSLFCLRDRFVQLTLRWRVRWQSTDSKTTNIRSKLSRVPGLWDPSVAVRQVVQWWSAAGG